MIKDSWQGKVLQNKDNIYIPVNKLGAGSYAGVWVCYWQNKKKLVAIKIFKPDEKKSGKKETKIYTEFHNYGIRNVITMYDNFIYDDNNFCIVFDLMIGSIFDIMKRGRCGDNIYRKGFPVDFVINTAYSILQSLNDLHSKNIIHGDIKPENILLSGRIKLHNEILEKLSPKTSTKKIIELIKKTYKNILRTDSDYDSNSCSESNNYNDNDVDKYVDNDVDNYNENNDANNDQHNDNRKKLHDFTNDDKDSTDDSVMSHDPKLIILSDTDTDNDSDSASRTISHRSDSNYDSDSSYDTHSSEKIYIDVDQDHILNPKMKLSDLGSCIEISSNKKPKSIQTKYYRSPEVLLGLDYDESCDIWALACTLCEMITGRILFDPDDYNQDHKRSLMQLIYLKLGKFPNDLIDISPLKQVFFTSSNILKINDMDDCVIKNSESNYKSNTWANLMKCMNCSTIKKYLFLDLILEMLKVDPRKRISAFDALNHPLFKSLNKHSKSDRY